MSLLSVSEYLTPKNLVFAGALSLLSGCSNFTINSEINSIRPQISKVLPPECDKVSYTCPNNEPSCRLEETSIKGEVYVNILAKEGNIFINGLPKDEFLEKCHSPQKTSLPMNMEAEIIF